MKIAIISEGFQGSTLSLAGSLCSSNHVDILFLMGLRGRLNNFEAFSSPQKIPPFILTNIKLNHSRGISFIKNKKNLSIYVWKNKFERKGMFKILSNFNLKYCNYKLKKYDFVIVIGQSKYMSDLSVILQKAGIPNIHTFHEICFKGTKEILNTVNEVLMAGIPTLTHSEYLYKKLQEIYPQHDKNIHCIPMGAFLGYKDFNHDKQVILELLPNEDYVLSYGYIEPYKGYDQLWNLYIDLKNKHRLNFKFVIAGTGKNPYVDRMKNNEDFIVINRWLDNDDLATLIAHSSLIICTYNRASQSGIPLTAFCFNKLVLATNVGAFSEEIQNGINGYVCDDMIQMEDYLTELMNKHCDLNKNIAIHKCSYSNEYNWNSIGKMYDKLFIDIMNKSIMKDVSQGK